MILPPPKKKLNKTIKLKSKNNIQHTKKHIENKVKKNILKMRIHLLKELLVDLIKETNTATT